MGAEKTSLSMLEQAKAGVEPAWNQLQLLYTPLIYYWCRQAGVRAGQVEEVWANILGRVVHSIGRFEHNGRPGAFRNWLRAITRTEIAEFFRDDNETITYDRLQDEPEADVQASLSIEASILYHQAWEVIRSEFSDRDNDVFRRVVENGETPKHVAEDLEISTSAVYTIVCRIKNRLRQRFGDMLDE